MSASARIRQPGQHFKNRSHNERGQCGILRNFQPAKTDLDITRQKS